MPFLLKLKSWQLFILIIVPAFISNSLSIYSTIVSLSLLISFSWIYIVGTTMHSLIPVSVKPNIKYFRFYFLLIIIALIMIGIAQFSRDNSTTWLSVTGGGIYIVGFICACGFAGKMLESIIEGEIVNNSDALKATICFLIFPIGLWYIQPAVQRVLAKYDKQAS
jgi:hypothetical protein